MVVGGCKEEGKAPVREQEQQDTGTTMPSNSGQTGTITGKVIFIGTPPEPKKVVVTIDQYACGEEKLSKDLIVSKAGGIQNVVIYLNQVSGEFPQRQDVAYQLDQNGCSFEPHVFMVPAGAKAEVLNSDRVLHNFHTFSAKNAPINKNQSRNRKVMNVSFEQPEIIKLQCDVHSWMNGWIVVTDHPYYALTNANGEFTLENVPSGTHTLSVWQEVLGEQKQTITVDVGDSTTVSIEFGS